MAVFDFCLAKSRKYGDAFFELKHKSYYRGSSSPLFSATVSLFVVESYERLSPDPGKQTVFLLNKLSQQLAGIAKGALHPVIPNITHTILALLWWRWRITDQIATPERYFKEIARGCIMLDKPHIVPDTHAMSHALP
ncbi:hypothetical protein EDB89DRAFT_2077515 [Lactarius sanguifluus]|nr:hypothetical protein EDB89DRAFT_2077515 [Lactarius sanguifluus]